MTQAIKVLVITPHYAPDFGPSAPIFTALCEDLCNLGCDMTVVTGFPHYGGADALLHPSNRFFEEERRNGVRVLRTYVYAVPKGALWRRLLYHGSFNVFSTLAALRIRNPDIVLADAPTLWSGLPLIMKAVLPRVPYIYIVYDIYPDILSRLGVLTNPKMLGAIERVERFFCGRSAQVSVLSPGFKENLVRKGVPPEKITIVPACVDTDFVRPMPRQNKLRERWGLTDKFVVLYAGNIGFSQGLEMALKAAALLSDHPEIALVLVGEGASKPALEALAAEHVLTNVKFFPFQPRDDVPLVYGLADVSLVSLKADVVVESVPSKTYTIMASGRPVLAAVDEATEVGHLITEVGFGLRVEPGDAKALVQAILRLYSDEAMRNEMGMRGRTYAAEHF